MLSRFVINIMIEQPIEERIEKLLSIDDNQSMLDLCNIAKLDIKNDFAGADLTSVNLSNQSLQYSNFKRTNFSSAKLTSANFSSSDLSGENFSDAEVENGNFSNCNLQNANFDEANLDGAILQRQT